MINTNQLTQKFNSAIRWNSLLFFVNKISKTTISFLLFHKLGSKDFSVWANVYSFIFIFELWSDFGFRRSLPQYSLIFAKNNKAKKEFIAKVVLFKIFVSLIINFFFLIFSPQIARFLGLSNYLPYFYLGCLLFLIESIRSVLQIIFYSYFWQKTYNQIETTATTFHVVAIFIVLNTIISNNSFLYFIFGSQILFSFLVVVISIFLLKSLFKNQEYQGDEKLNIKKVMKDFITHSAVMWSLISINSLTERNFLLPFLTYVLGYKFANIFKVANDAALLFQRFVIKSIGTTGTSLFALIEAKQLNDSNLKPKENGQLLQEIFSKLTKRTISLVAPLFGILLFVYLQARKQNFHFISFSTSNKQILNIFLLLTSLYLVQLIFMAYIRALEVKRLYKKLYISLLPYLGIIGLFIYCITAKINLTLPTILLSVHLLRIASLVIRVIYSKSIFNFKFPYKYLFKFIFFSLIAAILSSYILLKFNLFHYFSA